MFQFQTVTQIALRFVSLAMGQPELGPWLGVVVVWQSPLPGYIAIGLGALAFAKVLGTIVE